MIAKIFLTSVLLFVIALGLLNDSDHDNYDTSETIIAFIGVVSFLGMIGSVIAAIWVYL